MGAWRAQRRDAEDDESRGDHAAEYNRPGPRAEQEISQPEYPESQADTDVPPSEQSRTHALDQTTHRRFAQLAAYHGQYHKNRRAAIRSIAAAAVALPAAAQTQQNETPVDIRAAYTPRFFVAGQMKTVASLVDLIIPRTDTPGASDARSQRL